MGLRQLEAIRFTTVVDGETSVSAHPRLLGRHGDLVGQGDTDLCLPGSGERHTSRDAVALADGVAWEVLDELADASRAMWRARSMALDDGDRTTVALLDELLARLPDQRVRRRT